jgi:molecular chaperone HtpG
MKRFQQMTKSMGNNAFQMPIKKTLVVNPQNPLIKNALKIWEKGEKKELAEKIAHHVQDLASISSEGLSPEEKEKFVTRSQQLVQELSGFVIQ